MGRGVKVVLGVTRVELHDILEILILRGRNSKRDLHDEPTDCFGARRSCQGARISIDGGSLN